MTVGSDVTIRCSVVMTRLEVDVNVTIHLSDPSGKNLITTIQSLTSFGITYTSTATVGSFSRDQSGNYTCNVTYFSPDNRFLLDSDSHIETLRVTVGRYTVDSKWKAHNINIIFIQEYTFLQMAQHLIMIVTSQSLTLVKQIPLTKILQIMHFNALLTRCHVVIEINLESGCSLMVQLFQNKIMLLHSTSTEVYDGTVNLNRLNDSVIPIGKFCCVVTDAEDKSNYICIRVEPESEC